MGISVHPQNGKVYVADCSNHRVQILNPNLMFSSSCGKGYRQFQYPRGVAFDSTRNVYVADCKNHRIQVFTIDGEYLTQFGQEGKSQGELNKPTNICIDRV